jgi:4-hydroxybenzoate polyprenyltransferase
MKVKDVGENLGTLASIARIHIVVIGALGTLTFAYALCGVRPFLLAALCASDWFVVNLLNRVVDLKEDAANRIRGTEVVARHRRAVLVVGFGALVLSFVATALLVPMLLPFRVAFHALGFAYNWPLLPGRRRIKQLAFWKNTASATGFLLTVFCYPLATSSTSSDVGAATVLAAALFFFLFELSYEVLYDLRDVDGDRVADVRTWPVLFGPAIAWRIAAGLMLASFAVVVVTWALGVLPWRVAVMGAAPLLQLAVSSRMVKRGITTADCVSITWLGAALLAGYHVWDALGLPGAR